MTVKFLRFVGNGPSTVTRRDARTIGNQTPEEAYLSLRQWRSKLITDKPRQAAVENAACVNELIGMDLVGLFLPVEADNLNEFSDAANKAKQAWDDRDMEGDKDGLKVLWRARNQAVEDLCFAIGSNLPVIYTDSEGNDKTIAEGGFITNDGMYNYSSTTPAKFISEGYSIYKMRNIRSANSIA